MNRKTNLQVSDHAVLRYLERQYKFDTEAARQEILERVVAPEGFSATIKVPAGEGLRAVIKNNTIVTLVKE